MTEYASFLKTSNQSEWRRGQYNDQKQGVQDADSATTAVCGKGPLWQGVVECHWGQAGTGGEEMASHFFHNSILYTQDGSAEEGGGSRWWGEQGGKPAP